jgi:hypothetical protein
MRKPPDEKEARRLATDGQKVLQNGSKVVELSDEVKLPVTAVCTLFRVPRWLDAPPTFAGGVVLGDQVIDIVIEERTYSPGHRFFVARPELIGRVNEGQEGEHGSDRFR